MSFEHLSTNEHKCQYRLRDLRGGVYKFQCRSCYVVYYILARRFWG